MRTFLILLSAATFASANQFEFNLGRGTPLSEVQATGSSEKEGSRGTQWFASLLHPTAARYYFGIGGGIERSGTRDSATFATNAYSTISSKKSSILLLTRTDLSPPGRMVPYAIAGVGWTRNSLTITSDQGILLDNSKDTLGYETGLGLDYSLTDALFIGIQAQYEGSYPRSFDLTSQGQSITGVSTLKSPLNSYGVGVKAGIKY